MMMTNIEMFVIMILAGLLSTMNMWADDISHIYLSLNDAYMILLMTGWMFFFMGLYMKDVRTFVFGGILASVSFYAIRTQLFITETQFLRGMIPHHSMALHMSKHLRNRENRIQPLLTNIIVSQEEEIYLMKMELQRKL